jgi:hypothetical protein
MAAQFVFFYLVSLLLAVKNPWPTVWILGVYVSAVIRSIWISRRWH